MMKRRYAALATIGLALFLPTWMARTSAAPPAPDLLAQEPVDPALAPIRAVTRGPRFHWFGYYDKYQLDRSGRYLLAMQVDFEHRSPEPDDVIAIGMVDLENDDRWIELGHSRAWCWQQGCMLQWRPGFKDQVLWNDREGDRFVTRILDVKTRQMRTVPMAVNHVSPDGKWAVTSDFSRVQDARAGYGYAGLADPCRDDPAPAESGVWLVDLESGQSKLVVSLAQIAAIPYSGAKEKDRHRAYHCMWNPDGSRFLFYNRWPGGTRVFTAAPDGSAPRLLSGSGASHYTWRDPEHVVIWNRGGYHLYQDDGSGRHTETLWNAPNGHQTFVPGTNNEWMVTDTYPLGDDREQILYLFHLPTSRAVVLGRFPQPAEYRGEWRCDLHPRVSRDGKLVVIDSPRGGDGRQQHVIDISRIVEGTGEKQEGEKEDANWEPLVGPEERYAANPTLPAPGACPDPGSIVGYDGKSWTLIHNSNGPRNSNTKLAVSEEGADWQHVHDRPLLTAEHRRVGSSGLTGVAAGGDWPMWGYDSSRGGAAPAAVDLPETLRLQWVRELPPPRPAWPKQWDDGDKLEFDLSYTPIVMDNRLFVASMTTDSLTAYAAGTGEELWRFYADGPARVAPAACSGKVYFVSDDGRLYCLDAASGQLLWKFDAAPADHRLLGNERVISMWPARGGPVVEDGTVYFAAGVWPFLGTFVYALNAETGEVQWGNTGHATEWQAQPHGGAYAFAGLAPQGYLAVADDRLVVSGGRSLPGLFDRRDGTLLHSQVRAKPQGGYRVQVEGEHYFNHGRRYRLSDGGEAGDGKIENEAWAALRARVASVEKQLDDAVFESLAARGRLYVTTRSGRLYCFGAETVDAPRTFAYRPATPEPDDTPAGRQAASILAQTGVTDGYALVLGAGDGKLLEQLAVRSALHLVALEPDREKVDAVRRRLDDAGLYGRRVAVIPGQFDQTHYPPYISSLVVAAEPRAAGLAANVETFDRIHERLRPYGGRAYLGFDPPAFSWDKSPACQQAAENGAILLTRDGPLPGAGQWTHQHGDAANTVYSDDDRVRLPLGILWFGGPSNDNILPRHGHGPIPQAVSGRVILPGVETLSARCVYTGRELWERRFPGIGHPFTDLDLEKRYRQGTSVFLHRDGTGLGAHYIGSPYVSMPDAIYVRYKTRVFRLDPATGDVQAEFELPVQEDDRDAPDWGHISVWEDVLIVTTDPHIFRDDDPNRRFTDMADIKGREWTATSSRTLAVLDRHSGKLLWSREAEVGFRHNAVVTGGGTVFVIDGLSERAIEVLERRGRKLDEPAVVAFDAMTGEEKWRIDSRVFGTWLGYSEEFDVLIEAGRRGGLRDLPDEPSNRIRAYQGSDGSVRWERAIDYTGPIAIHGDTLLTAMYWQHTGSPHRMSAEQQGRRLQLLTGEDFMRQHPLTGESVPWTYWRTYGCNTANASKHLITFRSGAAGFADLENDGGTGTLGGFRAGCTANMIAADGVLLVPDYTRTCTCSYQNQTSVGLIHMPEVDVWTANRVGRGSRHLARLGINLGAPGNRRAEDGTLWIDYPRSAAPAPETDVDIQGDHVAWYRKHSLLVDASDGHRWVAASGGEGVEVARIGNLEHARYRVRLHFVEPRLDTPGQRVFDVLLQGTSVLENFDIVRVAGGPDRGVVRQFDVDVDGALTVELRADSSSQSPPVISGIELIAIDAAVATLPVPSLSRASVTLAGELARADKARSVEVFFRWRATGDSAWRATSARPPAETDRFSETLDGLTTDTPYEFQAVARVDGQEMAGVPRTFVPGDRFALVFDDHHVHVPHHDALNPASGSYTFEAWAKLDSADDAGDPWDLIIAKRSPNGYYVGMRRGHGWNFMLRDDEGNRTDTQSDRAIAEIHDRWVFVQAVVDRSNDRQILRVFDPRHNVWHEAAVTPPGNIGTTNDLYFGKDVDAGRFQVGGKLGPIRFWNTARTRQEAEADMNSRLSGQESGLAAYWPLRDGYGDNRLIDLSTAENHGRIAGAGWTTRQVGYHLARPRGKR